MVWLQDEPGACSRNVRRRPLFTVSCRVHMCAGSSCASDKCGCCHIVVCDRFETEGMFSGRLTNSKVWLDIGIVMPSWSLSSATCVCVFSKQFCQYQNVGHHSPIIYDKERVKWKILHILYDLSIFEKLYPIPVVYYDLIFNRHLMRSLPLHLLLVIIVHMFHVINKLTVNTLFILLFVVVFFLIGCLIWQNSVK